MWCAVVAMCEMVGNKKPPSAQLLHEGCALVGGPPQMLKACFGWSDTNAPTKYYKHFTGFHSARR
jgi:hypothetical protein